MRVLVIGDDKRLAETLVMILQRAGHQPAAAYDCATALQRAQSLLPGWVVSDVILPDGNGFETCSNIRLKPPGCHVLLFSGQIAFSDLHDRARVNRSNWDMMVKPVPPDQLLATLAAFDTSQATPSPEQLPDFGIG